MTKLDALKEELAELEETRWAAQESLKDLILDIEFLEEQIEELENQQ